MMIRRFCEVSATDSDLVGGKGASLGEMMRQLTTAGVVVPDGFVVTTEAYRAVIATNNIGPVLEALVDATRSGDSGSVRDCSEAIRARIAAAVLPAPVREAVAQAYRALSEQYGESDLVVAVRSSAVAEDRPEASFAGQQESFLNVTGIDALERAILGCMASLFTERAIHYRTTLQIPASLVALAVCVQKMVDTSCGSAGVMFTLDPDTGFRSVIAINALYGLGELLVQGAVNPDEYLVYKERLAGHQRAILRKRKGRLHEALRMAPVDACVVGSRTVVVPLTAEQRQSFVLNDHQICRLAEMGLAIEQHYGVPMDIEWAYDGGADRFYIVQARPETVYSRRTEAQLQARRYRYLQPPSDADRIITGNAIGYGIAQGTARRIASLEERGRFTDGDILVVAMTDPDWLPLMRRASAIVTDIGGRTCHAAIVSRELGIPAVIGTERGMELIRDGEAITVDASYGLQGAVYRGKHPFVVDTIPLTGQQPYRAKLLLNSAQPDQAFLHGMLPVAGIGLARLEFIMANSIGIHPLAVLTPEHLLAREQEEIAERAAGYGSVRHFFVSRLAEGIASLAAALYPRPIIVRFSDFKTNEYRNLIGGRLFEHDEENPMLGWRGVARYIHPTYEQAFLLECEAMRTVREVMGFTNVHCMLPFVRSVAEAAAIDRILQRAQLARSETFLRYMMVELPVNVLLLEEFAPFFDGFSIGSNDLTQLTLGVDRDSTILSSAFDERNGAVKQLIAMAIAKAHALGKPIGICGEAPSTYPEYASWLVEQGIDSISVSPDACIAALARSCVGGPSQE